MQLRWIAEACLRLDQDVLLRISRKVARQTSVTAAKLKQRNKRSGSLRVHTCNDTCNDDVVMIETISDEFASLGRRLAHPEA